MRTVEPGTARRGSAGPQDRPERRAARLETSREPARGSGLEGRGLGRRDARVAVGAHGLVEPGAAVGVEQSLAGAVRGGLHPDVLDREPPAHRTDLERVLRASREARQGRHLLALGDAVHSALEANRPVDAGGHQEGHLPDDARGVAAEGHQHLGGIPAQPAEEVEVQVAGLHARDVAPDRLADDTLLDQLGRVVLQREPGPVRADGDDPIVGIDRVQTRGCFVQRCLFAQARRGFQGTDGRGCKTGERRFHCGPAPVLAPDSPRFRSRREPWRGTRGPRPARPGRGVHSRARRERGSKAAGPPPPSARTDSPRARGW